MRSSSTPLPWTTAAARSPRISTPLASASLARLVDGAGGDLGEVHRFAVDDLVVAAGEQQQALDQLLAALVGGQQRLAELLELDRGAGVGEVHLEQRAVDRQRGAQLVRGVGDEALLRGEGPLQAVQHLVEGVGELLELVVGAVQLDPPGQVGAGHPAGGAGDPAERRQDPAGHRVPEGEGDDAEADQGEQGAAEEVVQGLLALLGHAGADRVVELRDGAASGELAAAAGQRDVLAAHDLERELLPACRAWAASR